MTTEQYRELTTRIDKAHRIWARLTEAATMAMYERDYARMLRICARAHAVSLHLDALIGQQTAAEDEA